MSEILKQVQDDTIGALWLPGDGISSGWRDEGMVVAQWLTNNGIISVYIKVHNFICIFGTGHASCVHMMPLLLRVRFFQVLLGAVLTLIVSLVFGAMPQEVVATAGVPCHTITSPTTVISSKYGSPINFFGAFPTPLLTVSCVSDGSMVFTAGDAGADTYIYKYAYHKVQGKWQKITFTGGKLEGVWYRGTAEAVLSNPTTGGDGSVLAYMCQKVAGAWKCGCADKVCARPKWEIQ